MNRLSIAATACAALLALAGCGSGPSDADVSKALNSYIVMLAGKQDVPASIKESKCAKAANGDAWECDFTAEGGDFVAMAGSAHHARLVKLGGGWKIAGQLS